MKSRSSSSSLLGLTDGFVLTFPHGLAAKRVSGSVNVCAFVKGET
ncbi:hypothetical protein [Hoylesella nanceiensis]|nr:hypothetical protein [Hoylesella nanceiensis]